MNRKWPLLFPLIAIAFSFCFYVKETFEPKIGFVLTPDQVLSLPSLPLVPETPWKEEYTIAQGFYHNLELYQAITAFKRAKILCTTPDASLRLCYDILFCYYLAQKYDEVITTFENSALTKATSQFPLYHDLLILLFESYMRLGLEGKASKILSLLPSQEAQTLSLWAALSQGDLSNLPQEGALQSLLHTFENQKKSVFLTQLLNTLLPGTGYLYLHQPQSSLTSFFLNGSFIWAACHSFLKRSFAAGLIFTSVEMGWYYGGIYGGGEEANYYNKRVYETLARAYMTSHQLFPFYLLHYGI